ncbi:hypothetical protein [Dyadobacter sp. LHD-138]|uniref:hypothetical protein n=1 Tax=Dyadobacter sp. LHD-138 TaxID=3071413 RepID=UPI0027E20682|nr:hypothetical protein [Dyadobacter sp. LHD-138]MDQ6479351.1 hypothetical protein [Dyadobacter sp. LHD-138]
MIWINKKEWLLIIFSLLLLFSGGAYLYLSPEYDEYYIHELGATKTIWENPHKSGNSALVIKVEGYANDDYGLKLDYYHKASHDSKSFKRTHSEIIKFPAGDIHGTLRRDFHGNQDNSKVNITYMPEHESAIKGTIKLKVGIF